MSGATSYLTSGVFLEDALWKIRGALSLLTSIDAECTNTERLVEGAHVLGTEVIEALEWIEEHKMPWTGGPPEHDGRTLEIQLTDAELALLQVAAKANGRTPEHQAAAILSRMLRARGRGMTTTNENAHAGTNGVGADSNVNRRPEEQFHESTRQE